LRRTFRHAHPLNLPRKIAIAGYGGAQSLDLNGPFEVFAMANRFGGVVAYEPILALPYDGAIVCNSGLSVAGSVDFAGGRG